MAGFLRRLLTDRFIAALVGTVVLASLLPARGGFAGVVNTTTTAAIVLLFFLHGVRLSRESVIAALVHWRLHSVILASTYALFPLLGLAIAFAVPSALPPPLWVGVLFLC